MVEEDLGSKPQGRTVNPLRIALMKKEIKCIGYVIFDNCVMADLVRIEAIQKIPRPNSAKRVRRGMGNCNFQTQFTSDYAELIIPMRKLLNCKNKKFKWEMMKKEYAKMIKPYLKAE